jgi:uncharacterized protein DUF4395
MPNASGSSTTRNFVLQQGVEPTNSGSCDRLASALQFQPRVVVLWCLVGVVTQSGAVFAALAAVLWWSVVVPRVNPFDALYHRFLADRRGGPRIPPAPAPRRFAQGMAGTFAGTIALCLFAGASGAAWVLEAVLLAAALAVAIGRFCFGSFVFHLLRGRLAFAIRTLPWGRGV